MAVRDVYEEGDAGAILAEAARGADLTVLAQEGGRGLEALGPHPIHHVVLSAGGPVLVLPRAGPGQAELGARVLVAWNGSREAARAAKDALPLLVAAEEVTLLAAGEDAAASLEAGAGLLRRHGARVAARQVEPGPGHGAALLDAAGAAGADLLVMGAYGHSRLREIVLGGATREVLRDARVPVLLSC